MTKLKLTRDIIPTAEMLKDADWTEAQFQTALERVVSDLGGRSWHARISIYSAKGMPDLQIWFPRADPFDSPTYIMAELKDYSGRCTPDQVETIASLRAAGVRVYVWHPRHYAQAVDVIQRLAGIEPAIPALPIDGEPPLDSWYGPNPKGSS